MLRLRQTAGTGRWDGRGGREAGLEGQHAGMLPAESMGGPVATVREVFGAEDGSPDA